MTTRKSINVSPDLHEQCQDTAWEDGRITVGRWSTEALKYYLRLTEDERIDFRETLAEENN
jgi:hypothetical protein